MFAWPGSVVWWTAVLLLQTGGWQQETGLHGLPGLRGHRQGEQGGGHPASTGRIFFCVFTGGIFFFYSYFSSYSVQCFSNWAVVGHRYYNNLCIQLWKSKHIPFFCPFSFFIALNHVHFRSPRRAHTLTLASTAASRPSLPPPVLPRT